MGTSRKGFRNNRRNHDYTKNGTERMASITLRIPHHVLYVQFYRDGRMGAADAGTPFVSHTIRVMKDTFIGFVLLLVCMFLTIVAAVVLTPEAEAQIVMTDIPQPEKFIATVTAYTSSIDETDSTPDITASGTRTRIGVAACPPQYAFGTRVQIGGKEYLCEDRMADKFADRFDVWRPTKKEAYTFGKRRTLVAVIK